jgi:type IV secretory pathway VirB4 component
MKYIIQSSPLFKESEVIDVILKTLRRANIMATYKDGRFEPQKNKATAFCSKVDNKIILSAEDKRIAKLGRGYLNTRRLTEKQWEIVTQALAIPYKLNLTVESDPLIPPTKFAKEKAYV